MQQRLVEREEKGRTEQERKGGSEGTVLAERKKEGRGPFLFPRTLPLFLLSRSRVRLSARTRSLARSLACTQGANRIRNKTNPMAGNARDQREDPTYTLKLDLGLSTSRSLSPCSPHRAPSLSLSSTWLSLKVSRCFSLRLSRNLSFAEIFAVPLARVRLE